MKFKNQSFTPTHWNYDKDFFNLLLQLKNTGVSVSSNQMPEFQPLYEGGKRMPFAWITMIWKYRILSTENKEVLIYEVHDKYQFNPKDYELQDVREMVATSFDAMSRYFDEKSIEGHHIDSIPEPEEPEFEKWCLKTLQFLNSQTGQTPQIPL